MATISTNFTSAIAGTSNLVVGPRESLTYALTGTFSATMRLEASISGGAAWEIVVPATTSAASGVLESIAPPGGYAWYRWRCTAYTSGTAETTIVDRTDVQITGSIKNDQGEDVLQIAENGVVLPQTLSVTGNATVGGTLGVTGATTLSSTLSTGGVTVTTGGIGVTGNSTITGTLGVTSALNTAQGSNVTAAATIDLDAATGNYVAVTGNTGISAITLSQGRERTVKFTGTPIITHGASLILPTAASITAAAGDTAVFVGEGSGVVKCVSYVRADGTPLALATTTKTLVSNGPARVGTTAGWVIPSGVNTYLAATLPAYLTGSGTNERQDFTPDAPPLEGSWKANLGGQTSAAIAYNASAATIQSTLEAMSTIGVGNVTVSGTVSPGGEAQVTFQGALAATDVAAMTVSDNTMHSDAGTAEQATLTCGAPAVSGTTKITFGGNSTANLAYNATAGTIETAVKALSGASNATVAGTFDAGLVTITFGADDGDVGAVTVTDDVLKSDAGTNEVQRLTCGANAVSGAIKVTYDGQTSSSIAYNATAATIRSTLEALPNVGVGNIGVTGGFDASPVELTFQGSLAATNVAEVATTDNTLKSDAGTNERQDITPDNTPDAGGYMIGYGGVWTTEIAFDDNAAAILVHLNAIPALNGNVSVSGDITTEVQITFTGALAATDVSAFQVAEVDLTDGGLPTELTVSEHTKGVVPAAVVVTPSTVTPGVVKTPVVVTPAEAVKGIAKTNVTLAVSEHVKGAHTDITAATVLLPAPPLEVGDVITGFHLIGQVESAGNTATIDADLRKHTAATADVTDASVGTITQVVATSDTKLDSSTAGKTGLAETVGQDESFYVKVTGTPDLLTDVALQGVGVTVTRTR